MSEAKHTPGPWSYVEHNWSDTSIYGADNKWLAKLSIRDEATEYTQEKLEKEMGANARLIAVAPEMLEVLERIVTYYQDETRPEARFKLDHAEKIINKARGKE